MNNITKEFRTTDGKVYIWNGKELIESKDVVYVKLDGLGGEEGRLETDGSKKKLTISKQTP